MVYVSLQSGSLVLLCSQVHITLHSTGIDFSGFWIRPLEHRPGAESVSPLKAKKKKKRIVNQSSPYLLQILNQNHPLVHLIAREKRKKTTKK